MQRLHKIPRLSYSATRPLTQIPAIVADPLQRPAHVQPLPQQRGTAGTLGCLRSAPPNSPGKENIMNFLGFLEAQEGGVDLIPYL